MSHLPPHRPHTATRERIIVLGGGIAGVAATTELDRRLGADVDLVLVSRDNFFLLSPLLFEACSGVLELRHCAQPIRACLQRARFIEATVDVVDVDRRVVRAVAAEGDVHELAYDHLIVALGASTNLTLIPGSEHARTFKTVADALLLRNHLIERFERADVETDARRREQLLTVAVIGGGLVGAELLGELTAFADDALRHYPRIHPSELRFHLFEVGERLLPESTPRLGAYAARVLRERGAAIHTGTPVHEIAPGVVRWRDGAVEADTIVLAAGIVPSTVASALGVERDERGRVVTDRTMRSVSHPEVWAIGDCAVIPAPDGTAYPALAQHAVREARAVARNVDAVLGGRTPAPFTYRTLGTMAAFGHTRAAVEARGLFVTGFVAWWMRRTYYLFQMPRWDTRLRIAFDWTVSLLFRPDLTKVDPALEREQERRNCAAGASPAPARSGTAHLPAPTFAAAVAASRSSYQAGARAFVPTSTEDR